MVSTRGPRYKFTEGERVLCYEPDPTKAKVLYDSKVLEVIETKDKRGRRSVEYLIHFQGWNSSWDRCVSEDFVLKDTEENRQLQRDLAERSQLQLGAYLYRRERKKGGERSGGSGLPAKRARHGFDDDASSSSTQPDDDCTEGETGDTDSSSASGSSASLPPAAPPPHPHTGRVYITLPSALRDRLTFDYHLVVKRGRLSALPATPCVADILEAFVRWYARAGAWSVPRKRSRSRRAPARPDLIDVSRRLNLVREVADGLRIYFDFLLCGHLLYKQELPQYHEIVGQFIDSNPDQPIIKTEKLETDDEDDNSFDDEMKSPKIPEYSHLPPDPEEPSPLAQPNTSAGLDSSASFFIKRESQDEVDMEPQVTVTVKSEPDPEPQAVGPEEQPAAVSEEPHNEVHEEPPTPPEKMWDVKPPVKPDSVARRLRSRKSETWNDPRDEPMPSTSTSEPRTMESHLSSVGSSSSSIGESWVCNRASRRSVSAPLEPPPARSPLSSLLDKVARWHIIPRDDTEHLPCRVYGAVHLSRLFVKLPDFLNAINMPDTKLKLLLRHIDMFVQYLNEHGEWFGETYYIADNTSRSH